MTRSTRSARRRNNVSITRDVSGEGVQPGVAEDARGDAGQHSPAGRPQASRAAIHPDGHDAGALQSAAARSWASRTSSASAWASGRSASTARTRRPRTSHDRAEVLAQVQPEDLNRVRHDPGVRRPGCRWWRRWKPLDTRTLISILTEPRNALVKQYQKFFRMEGPRWSSPQGPGDDRGQGSQAGHRSPRAAAGVRGLMLEFDVQAAGPANRGGKYIVNEGGGAGQRSLFEIKVEARKESA